MSYWLGIDAGTSGIKAIVIDENGNVCGKGYEELDVISPRPGYVEQNPKDWWRVCRNAVKAAVQTSGKGMLIEGIGVSGQMQGTVLIDKNGEPIRNCLIWLDQRATEEVKEIEERIKKAGISEIHITGNYGLSSFWVPKLLWVKKHEPELYERIYKVLFAKDYLVYCMTGEIVTEVSDASLSFLLDVNRRQWSETMFHVTGIPREIVPDRLLESCGVAGGLNASLAGEWGMKSGIPVVAGGGDQTANGVGTGIVKEGITGASIGTSAVVFGCTDSPFIDIKKRAVLSICHSVPGLWSYLGLSLTAGASLKWVRDVMFADKKAEFMTKGKDIYDYITGIAAKAKPGCEGVIFLPYFNGDSTPNNDAKARAGFLGLSLRSGMPEMCRSVMEGVAYSLRETIEICRELGNDVKEVRVSGGGSKSALWRQIQADIYNASVVTMNMEEGPAAGAAILAGVGAGYFKSVQEGCDAILKQGTIVDPIPENVKRYDEYFQIYHNLYRALKSSYDKQSELVNKYFDSAM